MGAFSAGVIADLFGLSWAIGFIGALTLLSGVVAAVLLEERRGKK